MLIDTHTHLYLPEFDDDIDDVISRALEKKIGKFYLPAIDSTHTDSMLALEVKFPANCFAMIGLHPCSVKADFESELQHVQAWLTKRSFAAVGEIGLDFYWDKTFVKEQYVCFQRQMELALDHNLPISIHSRDALQECIDLVKPYAARGLKGIFHCFGGTVQQAAAICDFGFKLGIGGVLTFKNSGLDKVIEDIMLEHLVLETDAPYLTPHPFRGKRNESSYLYYIAQKLAELKNVSLEEVKRVTTLTAESIFGSDANIEQ